MGLRDANGAIGAIYGETGRHQDLGPGGEPILSERMRVNGKVFILPTSSPLPSSINPRNQKL